MVKKRNVRRVERGRVSKNFVNLDRNNNFYGVFIFAVVFLIVALIGVSIVDLSERGMLNISGNVINGFASFFDSLFGTNALSATSVSRSFSVSSYSALPFVVSLTVSAGSADGVINYGIIESVPSGFVISNVNSTDFFSVSGNNITWIVNTSSDTIFVSPIRTISYTVTPSGSGVKTFSGNALFTSTLPTLRQEAVSIIGSTSISQTPAAVNNTLTTSVTGTGTITGTGINCGNGNTQCSFSYNNGTNVVLTANAVSGTSTFTSWGGACSGSASTCTVNMSQARSVSATFTNLPYNFTIGTSAVTVQQSSSASQTVTITQTSGSAESTSVSVSGLPTGVSVDASPKSCTTSGTVGSTCQISFTYSATAGASVGPTSVTLLGSSASVPTKTSTFTITVTSIPTNTLTTSVTGTGTITGTGINCGNGNTQCSSSYNNGTNVVLTANAVSGTSTFTSWGGACTGSGSDVTNGLIANWKFDQSSGSTTVDSSGNGNTLTLTGTPTFVTGNSGNAMSFSGDDSASESAINLASTNNFTISAWTNFAAFPSSSVLFETTTDYNSATTGILVFAEGSNILCQTGQIEVSLLGNVGKSSKCYAYPGNGWHHYAFVFNKGMPGNNEVNFYVDGVLRNAVSTPLTNDNTNSFGNNPIYLMSRAGTALMSSGVLDEVRVYNRSLTSSEINTVFSGAGTGTTSTCTVNMSEARSVSATFTNIPYNYTLSGSSVTVQQSSSASQTVTITQTSGSAESTSVSVSGLPTGVSVDASPKSCTPTTGSCQISFTYSATAGASVGSTFFTLTSSSASVPTKTNTFTITVTSIPTNTLTTSVTGTGTITGTGINCGNGNTDCSEAYNNGTSVVLTANAASGTSTFTSWGGACSGSASTCTLNMSEARSVSATFTNIPYNYNIGTSAVTVQQSSSASQTVTVTKTAGASAESTSVSVSGLPTGVSVDASPKSCTPTTGSCQISFTYSATAGASAATSTVTLTSSSTSTSAKTTTFSLSVTSIPTNTLTTSVTGTGTITGTGINCGNGNTQCSSSYNNGTNVVLTANAVSGTSTFVSFIGCTSTASNTCTVNMSEARSVSATFNSRPTGVDAGINQLIHMPTLSTTLSATASDDGLPTGSLTYTWTKVSGPAGTVVFSAPNALSTTATFPTNGTYILRINVSDGALTASDDVSVSVNAVPRVLASAPASITLPSSATLTASASDDGLPTAVLSYSWSTVSGPANAGFANSNALSTTATFPTNGTYMLRINVSDGVLSNSTTLTINVLPTVGFPTVSISSSSSSYIAPASITLSATASDSDGISLVRFFNGNNLLGTDLSAPYSIDLINVPSGNYQYKAQGVDNLGYSANSSIFAVTVTSLGDLDDDNDGVKNSNDACSNTAILTPVTVFGCPLPIASEFTKLSPNLSNVDLRSVADFEFGNTFGNISYISNVKVLDDYTSANAIPLNINQGVDISNGVITLNPTLVPTLNQPALLTFYNISKPKPYVTRNSALCNGCTIVSYNRNTKVLVLSVTGFSTYSVVDVKPDTGKFDYVNVNLSDEYLDIINLSAFSIGVSDYGIINYLENVSLMAENGTDVVGLNLSRFIDISRNKVLVDSVNAPELNKRARITFYNVTLTSPQILKDGSVCSTSDCSDVSYTNGTYSFVVSGFSTYELVEQTTVPPSSGGNSHGGGGGGGRPVTTVTGNSSNATEVNPGTSGAIIPGDEQPTTEVPQTSEDKPKPDSIMNIVIFILALSLIAVIIVVAILLNRKKKMLDPASFSAENVLAKKEDQKGDNLTGQ